MHFFFKKQKKEEKLQQEKWLEEQAKQIQKDLEAQSYQGLNTTTSGTAPFIHISPEEICRLCGKQYDSVIQINYLPFFPTCVTCTHKTISSIIEKLIPENDVMFCQTCKSHINACICEKNQALRKLKQ